jgi:subtilisin-like proprotein convertase family protein
MKKLLFILPIVFLATIVSAQTYTQTYTTTTGAIPVNGATPTCYPITVSGLGNGGIINTTYGLASVEINITKKHDEDLVISITAPDGTQVVLSNEEGGSGKNFTNTVFNGTSDTAIAAGTAPFTGNFQAETPLGAINDGQNGNGVWTICIQDVATGNPGVLLNYTLTFDTTPTPPIPIMPICSSNGIPTGDCSLAPLISNSQVFCGCTCAAYEPPHYWPALSDDTGGGAFCGTIEDNSFVKFIASDTTATFYLWVYDSQQGLGIQAFFWDGGCNGATCTSYGCYDQVLPDTLNNGAPTLITASNLTIGQTYYLMFDGYAGDYCNFTAEAFTGVYTNLPVTLSSFTATAKNKTIITNWHTATELNTNHFNVQRSTDGTSFTDIGTVKAVGSGANSYSFIDNKPTDGINYYRLQIVDKDGAVSYSKVVSCELSVVKPIAVYPNPSRDNVTISGSHIASIQVMDNLGRIVKVVELKDATNPSLSVNGLPAGVYHLRVQTSDGGVSAVGFVKE